MEYLAGLFSCGDHHHGHKNSKNSKKRQLQTVELKVRMDCDGCELKVKNALSSLKGSSPVLYFFFFQPNTNICIISCGFPGLNLNLNVLVSVCFWYDFSGVESVKINRKQQKVTVSGYVEASKVLRKAQSTGKKSELWPYVPYSAASQPYVAAAAYDRRAPPGHVRNVEASSAAYVSGGGRTEERLTNLFNDEDPNACSVM